MRIQGPTPFSSSTGPQWYNDKILARRALKRKLVLREPLDADEALAYPSPPMSSPPSPSRTQPAELSGGGGYPLTSAQTTSGGSISSFGPGFATTLPAASPAPGPVLFSQPPFYGPFAGGPLSTFPPPVSGEGWEPRYPVFGGQAFPATPNQPAGPAAARGRRSKTHVASACINCKRAHLSCDVNRPCARCVTSGKQDSCVDVQHKKRGRPRLREEGHLRNEPDLSPQSSAPSGPSQPGVRPIAGVRHRRGESFRSLRSQTSDGSPSYTASTPSTYLPTVPRQSPYGMQLPPTPSSAHPTYDVATALLNLDFVIIRANRPFQQIMLPGQDLRGRQIADVAAPADNEGFQSIRNRLRTEREAREPAYMPPIMQLGQDPVQDMPEAEAEQYTHGFQDNTYTWTHTRLGPASQQFPVRVRLAKANTYFVVVTLPSFRPIEPAPHQQQPPPLYSGPLALGPPLQPPERFLPPRHAAQSAPPQGYMPFQGVMAPPQPQHLPTPSHLAQGARTYPPPPQPQMMAYQDSANAPYQPFAPGTPRLPVAEPPTETTAFTPRTVPRELIPGTRASALQLPPIVPGPAGPAAGGQDGEEEEEGEEEQGMRSPKKRRRVGIHDVLQR